MKYIFNTHSRVLYIVPSFHQGQQILRSYSSKTHIAKCFSVLGVPFDSDQETVRQAFLKLVKKFHPDSGSAEANAEKFQEIETAYRDLQQKFAKDRGSVNEGLGEYGLYYQEKETECEGEIKEFDIKHTAPQHRQYLSYGGMGYGTPSQRQKQYSYFRAAKAVESINTYRLGKIQDPSEQAVMKRETKRKAKDIKTGLGMDRLVEDLIQESMARGDFDNLSGSGKPLNPKQLADNPYVDFITHKLNQVLIDNGFTPTWILYQKEIRQRTEKILETLKKERLKLGPCPLSSLDEEDWEKINKILVNDVAQLNDKINTYNLMVPVLQKQMLQFNLQKESDKILKEGKHRPEGMERPNVKLQEKNTGTFYEFLSALFTK